MKKNKKLILNPLVWGRLVLEYVISKRTYLIIVVTAILCIGYMQVGWEFVVAIVLSIFFTWLFYLLTSKQLGNTISYSRLENKIHMRMNSFASGDKDNGNLVKLIYLLIDSFLNDFKNLDWKYCKKGFSFKTHFTVIRSLLDRLKDYGFRYKLVYAENKELIGKKRFDRCIIFDKDGKEYTIYMKYKGQRYLYEAAYGSRTFKEYIKRAVPARDSYEFTIPGELLVSIKKELCGRECSSSESTL